MMETTDTANADIVRLIDEFVNHQIVDKSIPSIAVCVATGDRVLHKRIYHHAESTSPVPVLDKTLFRVASVSKLFTYVGLLQLVDRGLVSLLDPITKYVPDFAPLNPLVEIGDPEQQHGSVESPTREYFKEITVFNLIRHTSGLIREPLDGNYFNFEQCDLIELVASLSHSRLTIPPNKINKYSNAAVALIGYIIEVASGMVFEDYIDQNVLGPLGMNDSSFKNIHSNTDVQDEQSLRTAVGHMWRLWDETDTDLSVFTEAPHTHFGMNPAAGLRTTVNDISKFMQLLLNYGQPLLKKETFMQFITLQPLDTLAPPQMDFSFQPKDDLTRGLGIDILSFLGYKVVRHGGAINGFATDLRALPELNLSVFTCSTLDCTNAISIMISEYITLLLMPSLIKDIHSPLASQTKAELLEKVKEKSNFARLSLKATELDDKMYEVIKGLYKKGKHLQPYYPDSWLQKIYKEYNGKIYLRQNPFISKIKLVRDHEKTSIITSDRLSCNQVLFIFYNEDLDSEDVFFDYLDLQGKDKDFAESDGSLFYKPFICSNLVPALPSSSTNISCFNANDTDDQQTTCSSTILAPIDYFCLEPQVAPYIKYILGVYEAKDQIALIFEENGLLHVCIEWLFIYKLDFYSVSTDNDTKETRVSFKFTSEAMYNYEFLDFIVNSADCSPKRVELSGIPFVYKYVGAQGKQVGVYDEITCQKALADSLSIPVPFPQPEQHGLVDVGAMCDTIKVDLKYASSDNFSGITLYSGSATGRAYLHHQAATHLIKAHLWLVEHWGLGLVIFDSYRPWHVTWAMDRCVEAQYRGKYVADPTIGSVHNRGGAVDISLYSISSGEIILMPGDYDEFSFRSHRSYFGGTTTQRYYRKLLTTALINNKFSPYPQEWWHFDFLSDAPLPVLNIPFNKLLK
ncbi:hypothetical protein CYY_006718 [Polysphondylium violaceum]|uniref:Beta-lactamase-related domain-containing protein n=1 Tax=Polysphondylium violaceum TaxID=133409 RepID=A0A8J4PRG9_9MYCE|nr:hypothetical protein CYY_006718 [Polysphondylium violaceum]